MITSSSFSSSSSIFCRRSKTIIATSSSLNTALNTPYCCIQTTPSCFRTGMFFAFLYFYFQVIFRVYYTFWYSDLLLCILHIRVSFFMITKTSDSFTIIQMTTHLTRFLHTKFVICMCITKVQQQSLY